MPSTKPQVWTRIEPDLHERLRAEAKRLNVNESTVIRLAIIRLFGHIDRLREGGGDPDLFTIREFDESEAVPA